MSAESDFRRAADRYRKAQQQMEEARAQLRAAAVKARGEGMTLDAMGKALGVTRQRVLRFLRGE